MSELLRIEHARAKSVKPARLEEILDSDSWVAEEKFDGWRFLMHFGGNLPRAYLVGRRVSGVTGELSEKGLLVPCLWPSEERRTQCGYTVLDGEIMPPDGASFRDLASIMNASPEVSAASIERLGRPIFRVFDMPMCDGRDRRDWRHIDRVATIEPLLNWLGHDDIRPVVSRADGKRQFYSEVLARGGEGLILKRLDARYGVSGAWVKMKRAHTLDVVITDFTEAKFGVTGKYEGQIGAAVVSVWGPDGRMIEVGQVSGMDDETRLAMSEDQSAWLGTVIEIVAQEFARDRLRHPRFLRAKPEANNRECTLEKMIRDLGASAVDPEADAPVQGKLGL